jgi:hypothetical protein
MCKIPVAIVVFAIFAAVAAGCRVGGHPVQPTSIPATLAPVVPTHHPGVWDSRDELSGWVTNGLSSGPVTIVGEGDDALIRIDLPATPSINLHSPAFDPPVKDLRTFRIRYRWLPDGPYGGCCYLVLDFVLQDSVLNHAPTHLSVIVGNNHGEWVEEEGHPTMHDNPPFSPRGAVLHISGSGGIRGRLEIDWMALMRQ